MGGQRAIGSEKLLVRKPFGQGLQNEARFFANFVQPHIK